MIYIYRRAGSTGARQLAEAVNGRRAREFPSNLRSTDHVVFWGEHVPNFSGNALNNVPIRSKFTDAETLRTAGVSTIEVSRTRPVAPPTVIPTDPAIEAFERARQLAEDFAALTAPARSQPFRMGLEDLSISVGRLGLALDQPAPGAVQPVSSAEWIGRSNNHVGGNDLLAGNGTDYFTKRESFVAEYRVHSFAGRSIRAGKKVPREGYPTPHEWIRSWDGGWRIAYDGASVRQKHRNLAHQAIEALGLNFGAVDIGERADGSLVVLEVNRAPGLEGGTVLAYARAISAWAGQ